MVLPIEWVSEEEVGAAAVHGVGKGITWREARSSFAVIDEVRLHWVELGPASGDPLVGIRRRW